MTVAVEPVAITGCGVVSTAGIGLDRLRALVDGTRAAHAGPVAGDGAAYPPMNLRTVPGYDLGRQLGRKGVRRLDRMTGFGLLASREALGTAQPGRGTGVVVGTSTGSVRSIAEFSAELAVPDQPPVITPSRFPNAVLNCCASQVAIWHDLHGPNATVAAGSLSGVSALRYAANAIRRGYADGMLVGGVEELCAPLAWTWYRLGLVPADGALGEGAAFLLAERGTVDRPRLADLLAVDVGYHGSRPATGLATRIERALRRSGVGASEVDVVCLGGVQPGIARVERRAVTLALGGVPASTRIAEVVGECFSAAGGLQVAGLLARWSGGGHPEERVALVTGVGRDGNAGCAVLRRPGR